MSFITEIFSGGFLGVITSVFSTWFKYKEAQADREHQLKLIKAQTDANIREIEAQVEVNKIVVEGNIQTEYAKSEIAENVGRNSLIEKLTSNYIDKQTLNTMLTDNSWVGKFFRPFLFAHLMFMDLIRGSIRPVLTAGIIWYVTYLIDTALTKYLVSGSDTELMSMVIKPAVSLILFSASTVIGFWFADKSMSRRFQQGQK